MFQFQCISPSIVHILDFRIRMIVLLANGEISHITSNENFKVTVTEICFSALFRFFSTTPYTQGHNSVVNFPLSDTLFNDLAHFFTVCMFRSKPQRKKENPKGSAKKTRKLKNLFVLCPVNKLFRSYPILSLQQQTIQKVSMLFFLFFFLFNYRFKLYKLPTNPFLSAECNFIGFFFLFLDTCYLNFLFIFFPNLLSEVFFDCCIG